VEGHRRRDDITLAPKRGSPADAAAAFARAAQRELRGVERGWVERLAHAFTLDQLLGRALIERGPRPVREGHRAEARLLPRLRPRSDQRAVAPLRALHRAAVGARVVGDDVGVPEDV